MTLIMFNKVRKLVGLLFFCILFFSLSHSVLDAQGHVGAHHDPQGVARSGCGLGRVSLFPLHQFHLVQATRHLGAYARRYPAICVAGSLGP